jgi:PHD/YefM family antitoxin component YafN of YafNO toxin-antitoxin module
VLKAGGGPLEREHGRVVITKHGHPAAVVTSVEDLESLEDHRRRVDIVAVQHRSDIYRPRQL